MWTINGVDPSTYGLKVSGVPGWENAPALDYLTQQVPGKPGNVLMRSTPLIGARRIVVSGHVVGTSNADMLTKLDQLKAMFSAPSLVMVMDNRNTRQITCRLDGEFGPADVDASMVTRKIPVGFVLVADDPWWYDIATTGPTAADPDPGTAMPVGTAPVWPIITVTIQSTSTFAATVELRDSAGVLKGSLSVTHAYTIGDILLIDMAAKTIKINGVNSLDKLSAGDFFALDVSQHGNFLTSAWPKVARGAATSVTVSYKKAWR